MSRVLSVIIPTFNRTNSLKRLLRLLQQQNIIEDIEIIVVDQNDKKYLENEIKISQFHSVQHIYLDRPNVSLARNIGALRAKGKYLLFIDDDLVPEFDFCEKGIQLFSKYDFVHCFIPRITNKAANIENGTIRQGKIVRRINSELFEISEAMSAAVFCENNTFIKSGGFDVLLFEFAKTAEDQEFFLRFKFKGIKLYYTKAFSVFHDELQMGGCDLRTADYWVTRYKCMKAWIYRYKIHRGGNLDLRFIDYLRLYRSVFFNKHGLTSGLPIIKKQIAFFKMALNETNEYLSPYKDKYEVPSQINHLMN